jgi:hypothetical protein
MPSQQTSGKATGDDAEDDQRDLRCHTSTIDSLNIQSEATQLADEVGSLVDESFRPSVEQLDCAAKVFKTRWRRIWVVARHAGVLKVKAHQFEHRDQRIVVSYAVLPLPLCDRRR